MIQLQVEVKEVNGKTFNTKITELKSSNSTDTEHTIVLALCAAVTDRLNELGSKEIKKDEK